MKRRRFWGGLAFLFLLLAAMATAVAQEAGEAALVVRLADGETVSRCVPLTEPEMTGYDLLVASGLAHEVEVSGMGVTVCQIEATGCPVDDCFCHCQGGDECRYWSYWLQTDGAWQYSQVGAHLYQVQDGDVQGWVWGPGSPDSAPEPPPLTFADVCAAETAVSTAETAVPIATAVDAAPTTATPVPPAPDAAGSELSGWWMGGATVLILAGGGVLLALRRRSGA